MEHHHQAIPRPPCQGGELHARHAALDLLFGHPAETHRLLPEIYEKLTPEEVCAVARKVFASEPTVSVILGEKV